MPIYEYHCSKCGDFEIMQRMSDKPLSQCPTCKRKVTKLISSTSFQLKGSGWYITDYARKGEKGSAKSDKKTDAKGESAKTESGAGDGGGDGATTSTSDKSEKSEESTKKSEKAAAA